MERSQQSRGQMKPHTQARPFCIECPKGSGCHCGESPDAQFEWEFAVEDKSKTTIVIPEPRSVQFHPSYSVGTAVIRGTSSLSASRHHFFELRMTSPMYGTDVMIGVATAEADFSKYESDFVSALGIDANSWGSVFVRNLSRVLRFHRIRWFSYHGYVHHGGKHPRVYASHKWNEGTIIGVHLDRWRGTLEFYLNRKPLGIAFTNILPNLELYPVISSTAAKSSMRLICSQSYRCDLAFECVRALSRSRFFTAGAVHKTSSSSTSSAAGKSETVGAKTDALLKSLPPGLASFVDNNCWYLFGTRLKTERQITKPFTDNSADPKWFIVSSDDEMDVDKKSDKENKFDRKKMKLVAPGKASDDVKPKTETDTDDDQDDFAFSRHESDAESVTDTSCWRVFPASLSVDFSDDGAGESVRKRFVLRKQNKK